MTQLRELYEERCNHYRVWRMKKLTSIQAIIDYPKRTQTRASCIVAVHTLLDIIVAAKPSKTRKCARVKELMDEVNFICRLQVWCRR